MIYWSLNFVVFWWTSGSSSGGWGISSLFGASRSSSQENLLGKNLSGHSHVDQTIILKEVIPLSNCDFSLLAQSLLTSQSPILTHSFPKLVISPLSPCPTLSLSLYYMYISLSLPLSVLNCCFLFIHQLSLPPLQIEIKWSILHVSLIFLLILSSFIEERM